MRQEELIYPLRCETECMKHIGQVTNVLVTLRRDVLTIKEDHIIVMAFCKICQMDHRFVLSKNKIRCGGHQVPLRPDPDAPKILEVRLSVPRNIYGKMDYRCPHCGEWDESYGYSEVLCSSCSKLLPEIAAMIDSDDTDCVKEKLDYHLNGTDSV